MRRPFPYILIAAALALPWLNARSMDRPNRPIKATCPNVIPAKTFKADRVSTGWTAYIPNPMHLTAAGMMAGPPAAMLYLVPNESTRDSQTFDFEPGDRERWLWCAYGPAQLSRRLADSITRCTITSTDGKKDGMATFTAAIDCR